jgi:hypothetical protein
MFSFSLYYPSAGDGAEWLAAGSDRFTPGTVLQARRWNPETVCKYGEE